MKTDFVIYILKHIEVNDDGLLKIQSKECENVIVPEYFLFKNWKKQIKEYGLKWEEAK